MMDIREAIREKVNKTVNEIKDEIKQRQGVVAEMLIINKNDVLSGARSGREYKNPATGRKYTASAPGESPAYRTGAFYESFIPQVVTRGDEIRARISSMQECNSYNLAILFEEGTDKMDKRPFAEKILEQTAEDAFEILTEPYSDVFQGGV